MLRHNAVRVVRGPRLMPGAAAHRVADRLTPLPVPGPMRHSDVRASARLLRSEPSTLNAPASASELRPTATSADASPPEPSPAAPARWAVPLLAFAFVLSGGAGLIYESIWTRYLGLFVGHSA